ncbi:hypothetical protein BB558_003655 [Smittium angustum]|uniref:Peptide hydrolase n=1 Tax=Smittium angustum TaxID=133377 RepID=A0A2U1J5H1_SMIAN|nr:hypothetical protein BB558_003655 [Smittium angustum]
MPEPVHYTSKEYDHGADAYVVIHDNRHEIQSSKTISAILYYLVLILVYAALLALVIVMRLSDNNYSPPGGNYIFQPSKTPSSDSVPFDISTTEFRADVAHEYLRYLARTPHAFGSEANIENVKYLSAALNNLKKLADQNGVKMEIIESDPTIVTSVDTRKVKDYSTTKKLNNATSSYVEGGNVLARIIGLNGSEDNSILLSSHLDSQLVSPGATDDGINGAVMLEIVRHIIFNRLKSTVVFNFNNGEEIGLYGALGFMHHPWSETVKAFINIEGAGAGGRALVFRASNSDVINRYSKRTKGFVTKWRPHANVFANDAFKLGLISSDTDYTVYASYGIPGLDIAFYERRSVYHTESDSIENVPIGSVHQVGTVVLNAIKAMSDDEKYMASPRGKTDGIAIYYDVLGRFMVNHSFRIMEVIYIVLLVIIIIGTIVTRIYSRRSLSTEKDSTLTGTDVRSMYIPSMAIVRGCIFTSIAAIVSLVFSLCIGLLLGKVNFFVIYGYMFVVLATHAFGNLIGIGLVLYLWMFLEGKIKGNSFLHNRFIISRVATYSQLFIWWIAMLGGLLLAIIKGAGVLYYTSYFGIFSILAATWACFIEPAATKFRVTRFISWFFKLIIAIAVPLIICFDLAGTLVHGMAQTVIDGTGAVTVHLMFGIFTTASLIVSMPFLATPGKKHLGRLLLVFLLVFIGLILSCCFIKPFTKYSPSHVYFSGDLNLDSKVENTTILANNKFANIVDAMNKKFPQNSRSYESVGNAEPERYRGEWIGDSNFAKSFNDSNTALPSYKISKDIPDNFPGATLNKNNGVLVTISAPHSYGCMLTTDDTHAYSYVLHQYGISDAESNYTITATPSNVTDTIYPSDTTKFISFDHRDVPEGCCQNINMLTRRTNSEWIVYLEHYGDGFGDIELKCYYSEFGPFMPPVGVINSTIVGTSQTMGDMHGGLGLLSLTQKMSIN